MPTSKIEDEDIKPGGVNKARTKCCCQCCEQVMDFDPSWTAEQDCPLCNEALFAWSCISCFYAYVSHSQCDDPPFPDFPCDGCGETQEEQEQEENQGQRLKEENERIERGATYRKLEQNSQNQNLINRTATSLYTNNPKDAFNPKNLADALRIDKHTWEKLRPCVLQELAQQGYAHEDESVLSPTWGQRVLTFFERSWLEDNAEGLRCGVQHNNTGCLYFFASHLSCNLRSIRESFAECFGIYPTLPKVTIDQDSWQVSWEPDYPFPDDGDPREIYTTDGDKSLTFYEFILWCIRLGYGLDHEFNSKYFVKDTEIRVSQPIAYVPSDWVGRPKMWEIERDNDFRRFHWMGPPVYKWNGTKIQDGELEGMSRDHMEHCCVCYGSPPAGQDLLVCECKERLYCSKECKEKHMEVHKYHPTLKHPLEKRICCGCGVERTGLKRCGKCKYAYFCNLDCQRHAWDSHHKKQCMSC